MIEELDVLSATVTRPATTPTYTAGDVVGSAVTGYFSLTGAARSPGGRLRINTLQITKSTKNVTLAAFDLYVFDTLPAAIADDAEWLPTDAEILNLVGGVEIVATDWKQGGGSTNALCALCLKTNLNWIVKCAAGSTTLYGILVARAAHQPGSEEVLAVKLGVEKV